MKHHPIWFRGVIDDAMNALFDQEAKLTASTKWGDRVAQCPNTR